MTSVINFKFKSALSYDSVKFDGAFISVGELKGIIADKKGLSQDLRAELVLSDPRTKTEYTDAAQLLPKSSAVFVRRTPVVRQAAQPAQQRAGPPAAQPSGPGVSTARQRASVPGCQPRTRQTSSAARC